MNRKNGFTKKQDDIIAKEYPKHGSLTCQLRMKHKTVGSIQKRAAVLGIRHIRTNANVWKKSENDIIRRTYPTRGPNGCHKKLPHRSSDAIQSQARRLNVRMDLGERKRANSKPKGSQKLGKVDLRQVSARLRSYAPGYIAMCGRWV